MWREQLQSQPKAGGEYSISGASSASNGAIKIANLTYGDVYFCSGQ